MAWGRHDCFGGLCVGSAHNRDMCAGFEVWRYKAVPFAQCLGMAASDSVQKPQPAEDGRFLQCCRLLLQQRKTCG